MYRVQLVRAACLQLKGKPHAEFLWLEYELEMPVPPPEQLQLPCPNEPGEGEIVQVECTTWVCDDDGYYRSRLVSRDCDDLVEAIPIVERWLSQGWVLCPDGNLAYQRWDEWKEALRALMEAQDESP